MRLVETRQLRREVERQPMLSDRRRLVVEPEDGAVHVVHQRGQLSPIAVARDRRSTPGCPREDGIAPVEQGPDVPVGLDPAGRGAILLEQVVREPPLVLASLEWQPLAAERQIVEGAGLLGLADLALGEAFPRTADLDSALGVAADRAHDRIVPTRGPRRPA
jgi:hypothetical protein